MKITIQVIKVYSIEVDAIDADEAIENAYQMQTAEIEANGRLLDASTDFAETEEEVEANAKLLGSLRDKS